MRKWFRGQRGEVNIGLVMMMAIGFIFLAVGFIMFPNVTDACEDLLGYGYTCSGNASLNTTDETFTGLTTTIGIFPLLTLLGYIAVTVIAGFMGLRITQGAGNARLNVGGILMNAIALVFIALGLYIFPVLLDGVSSIYCGGGSGISSSFIGLEPIILMTPMLTLLGFVVGTVILGFFGIRIMSSGD